MSPLLLAENPLPFKYFSDAIVTQVIVITVLDLNKQHSGMSVPGATSAQPTPLRTKSSLFTLPALRLNISADIPSGAKGNGSDLNLLNL